MKENDTILRVALYIRVSTDRQAKEGDSLEAQENALLQYCENKKYIIVDKYIDGGESGQKIKRTNLQRMLEDVKQNKIDLILMTKLDRWFRNIGDFYKVIEIIKSHNTNWKTIWEDYDTTTASGEFWLNMSLSMGQLEAKRTSERIREVFNYKYNTQKTVCSGKCPYGYKIDENKHLVIDEDKKQSVIDLFNHFDKYNCLNETTRWFSANYFPISSYSMRKYLKNSVYIGKYRRYKTNEIIEDFAPAIIDEQLFYRVQEKFKKNIKKQQPDSSRKRHNEKPYIFTGLLFCKECGGRLSGKTGSNKNHYYNCRKHEKHTCTNMKCVKEELIEQYLLFNIVDILNTRKIDIIKINNQKDKFIDNSTQLKAKLNKLTSLYLEDLIDKDYYREQYNKLNKKIIDIENKKSELNKDIDYSYIDNILASDFLDIYNTLDNLEKRRLWGSVIDMIELTTVDDINVIVY